MVDEWTELATTLAEQGLPVEVSTPDRIVEMAPQISAEGLAIAIWEPNCGYADPPPPALPPALTNAVVAIDGTEPSFARDEPDRA